MSRKSDSISWLDTPASGLNTFPTETRIQTLPFEQLTWEDFERLCYRLARAEADVEHCQLYGNRGDKQEGIDIFARVLGSEKYRVYQCKREVDFGPAKIKSAVSEFINGDWFKKSDAFILCTQESLRSQQRSDELEKQAGILKPDGITLIPWDAEELSSRLKSRPEIVDDFFEREWVRAFCGEEAAKSLGERLEVAKLIELRSQLYSLYQIVFNIHDAGIPLPSILPLTKRYVNPDIEDVQAVAYEAPVSNRSSSPHRNDRSESDVDAEQARRQYAESGNRRYVQRIPIQNWIVRNKRSLLFGSPGSGKSTFLRFLALDLLSEEPALDKISEKWGTYIPLWIPFALWTKVISDGRIADRSIKAILEDLLRGWDADALVPLVASALKDKRLLLLVDGLDEYSNDDSAKIALDHLEIFLEKNNISIIATSRPNGFERLGMKLDGWQQAGIADFKIGQQRALADIWFYASCQKVNPDLGPEKTRVSVERQTSTFFAELGRSPELSELAKNPLLLCLLISFQLSNVRLPLGRFDSYEALTDHLISTHPQARRRAAEVPQQQQGLSPGDIKKTLAHLAFILHSEHPEGLLAEEEALEVLSNFLEDGHQGFGMDRSRSMQIARDILDQSENTLGILVKRSRTEIGFYHRTIQEYLTAFNISRLTMADQRSIVETHCEDPSWRDVILGLFRITKRPADVNVFLESIIKKSVSYSDKKNVDDLLSEVAFGDYNCPPSQARELALRSYEEIEQGTWMPQREKILWHVLDGLRSPILSTEVKTKLTSWFPDRVGYQRSTVFEAMSRWTTGPDVLEALFEGLNAEDYRVRTSAGSTLAKLYKGDQEVGRKLVLLANQSDDIYLSAAVTEALLEGWSNHKALPLILERFVSSPAPILQLVGITGKVEMGTQTNYELGKLLKLARWESGLYLFDKKIAGIIVGGWPRSQRVKDVCLKSVSQWGSNDRSTIERDIAQFILLEGYPGDEQVLEYCLNEIEKEQHPFNAGPGSIDAFHLLAVSFKNNPKLIAALEEWAEKNKQFREPELSFAALVGRTDAFKQRLLENLNRSFPHWAAAALLEGWGTNDHDVAKAFEEILKGPASISSKFAHLLPQIITDRKACRDKLLEMLSDPSCSRYDFVMSGFEKIGNMEDDGRIVDTALCVLEKIPSLDLSTFKAGLIRLYNFDPRVKELAIRAIQGRGEPYSAVAAAFGNDDDIRRMILNIANPAPPVLRQTVATYLSEAEVDPDFVLSLLGLYDHEVDEQVKVQASIGFHSKLKMSSADLTLPLERLKKDIVCYGPDFRERQLAAFCGLVLLDKLEIMSDLEEEASGPDRKVAVEGIEGIRINIPFVQFLLKNWAELKSFFKNEFWDRVFRYHSDLGTVWKNLSMFADEYEDPKDEILEYLEGIICKIAPSELLRFLGRTMPGSNLLLEYCLNTIHPDTIKERQQTQLTVLDEITAANLIGDHFAGDTVALKMIESKKNKWGPDELILTLSEGWPDSPELRQTLNDLAKSRRRCWESTVLRYHCIISGPITMYRQLLRLLRYLTSNHRHFQVEAVLRPIIRRLQKDDRLMRILMRHLGSCPRSSEKVSIPKLLQKARGLNPELREWCKQELEHQLKGDGIESGFDITTNEFQSVPSALFDILNGN